MSALPPSWTEVTLGQIASLINGDRGHNYPSKQSFQPTGVPFVNAGHLVDGRVSFEEMNYISEAAFNALGSGKVQPDDILFCLRGSLGKVGIVKGFDLGAIASSLAIVRNGPHVYCRYLYHYLRGPFTKGEIDRHNNGTAQPNLSSRSLGAFLVPLAPYAEQQRIGDKLDTVLARVDAVNARLARVGPLLKRFRQAVLAAATSGRLTEDWREQQAQVPDWTSATIGDVAVDLRYGTSQKCYLEKRGTAVLRIPNIGDRGAPVLSNLKYAVFDDKERAKLALQVGDLLIIRSNGSVDLVGKTCVVDASAAGLLFAGYLMRLRLDERKVLPGFVLLSISCPAVRQIVERTAKSTSGVNNINSEEVRSLPLSLPSMAEQTEIIRRVELLFAYADRLEARLQAAQTATERLTPALLAKAFRGELVPQDPDDEPAAELLKRLRAEPAAPAPRRRGVKAG